MTDSRYSQIKPNSHFWTDLEQLVHCIQFDNNWHATKAEREKQMKNTNYIVVDAYKPLTREYVLIGLKNSLKNGYDLKFNNNDLTEVPLAIDFKTVQEIIDYIEIHNNDDFNMNGFLNMIQHKINDGYNLTNNIKMGKNEVYKVIDDELHYQDLRWVPRRKANGTPDETKPTAEWINYMEFHLTKAKEAVYYLKDEEALAEIRKVTALGVRALMIHGCPERIIPKELLNQK